MGEGIVQRCLEKRGYVCYKCVTEKAHAFDFLAVKDKEVIAIAEVKTKARLNNYAATGVNVTHYNEYRKIAERYGLDIILFFVDEHPKIEAVYCQKLSKLMEKLVVDGVEYPNTGIAKGIVLFSLRAMIMVQKLTKQEVEDLKKLSTRSHDYT